MKFLYYIITFIAISLTSNLQAQQQHVIPITPVTTINNQPDQTLQPTHVARNKKRKFTQKTSITRHSKIKKVCLYTGLALGIIAGLLLMDLTMPIIFATCKATMAIACLIMTGRIQ